MVIKGLVAMGKEFNEQAEALYKTSQKIKRPAVELQEESKALREAIDLQLEGVLDVERIIFDLRKDGRYAVLFDLADDF